MSNNCRIIITELARTGKKNSSDLEIVKEILTEYELIIDSYEQAIERPKKYEKQKEYYSGKKKSQTRKSQVIVLPNGKDIVDVEKKKTREKKWHKFFSWNLGKILSKTKIYWG